jgi:two-component system response regulator
LRDSRFAECRPEKWHFAFGRGWLHPIIVKSTILVVEDSEIEQMLARKAISRSGLECNVLMARDGEEACRILFEGDGPPPDLVLLDLQLPKLSGFEVLERVRASEITQSLPIVVLSSSDEPCDLKRSFLLHANSYVRKDIDPDTYDSKLKLILYYWIGVNHRLS